ncbi:MAG: TetR/AcrR family transcriptional regulator [Bryobacteraceae bacterium]|nr:TetR/AcrR family transcriptional regulator [Bryobacteraceae bacterium]
MTAAERRAAIVEAAIQRFALHGFRGTTTRELAAAAGVSEPVLYQHFATKRELYTAIVDHLIAQTHARFDERARSLAPNCTDREFFQWLGEAIISYYSDTPEQIRLLLFSALEGHELAELWYQKATVEFIRWVEQYVERRVAEGAFAMKEPEVVARAFIFMVAHYGFSALLFPEHRLKLENSEIVAKFVDIFLNGILAKGSTSGAIHAGK